MNKTRVDRVGETSIASNGMVITLTTYNNYSDVSVRFEDGYEVEHISYQRFKDGYIKHQCKKAQKNKKHRVGEISRASNGMTITIIKYRKYSDIDVQFEDGTVVEHTAYQKFKVGHIRHPYNSFLDVQRHSRIGEVVICNNGLKATIKDYHSSENLDVEFEDGVIIHNVKYQNFCLGKITHPILDTSHKRINRLGEEKLNKNGVKMKIVRWGDTKDIDVQLETGEIFYNKQYAQFKKGSLFKPDYSKRVGETNRNNQGELMIISRYVSNKQIAVEFDDKCEVKAEYQQFKRGEVLHPKFRNKQYVCTFNNEKWFLCACRKCKNKHMLKLSDMKDFECTQL